MSLSEASIEPYNALRPAAGWPTPFQIASEPARALVEAGSLCFRYRALLRRVPRGDGRPVLTLPGYGGADGSMLALRHFLRATGYQVHPLNLGRNLDGGDDRIRSVDDALRFRDKMVSAVIRRVGQIHAATGEPVTLIGWSLGGVYAVDVLQQIPTRLRQVVTLGSPFGDPRGTTLFNVMRRVSGSKVPLEGQDYKGWCERARLRKSDIPLTVVYSAQDGIVSTGIAGLENDSCVRYCRVNSSHIGFPNNPEVLGLIAEELYSQS